MKHKIILLILLLAALRTMAQENELPLNNEKDIPSTFAASEVKNSDGDAKLYHINKAVDYPVILVLGGTSLYLISAVVYRKTATPESDILKLNKNNVPSFDRWTAGWHDANIDKFSYIPFYGVMPLPLLFLADKKIAKDKGTVGLLYLEAFAFEGILYTSSVYFIQRYRPDVYNTDLPLSYRTNGNFRNSFFAGHVAVVANTTFFMSKVYLDYHPESHLKWVLYGISSAATLGMGYLRLEAGKHFTSDIVTGIAVGVGCGLLTPTLHKNRDYSKQKWSLLPSLLDKGTGGFTFTYKL